MNEKAFYSKNFAVKCPVWILVDEKLEKVTAGDVILIEGKPSLGYFFPLFLSIEAVGSMAVTIERACKPRKLAAVEIRTPKNLCRLIKLAEAKNVVVYLKKDCTRFYERKISLRNSKDTCGTEGVATINEWRQRQGKRLLVVSAKLSGTKTVPLSELVRS